MKKVEKYIKQAIDQVESTISEKDENKKSTGIVLNVYNGYISAMGASIIQSGLLPTLASFESTKDNEKEGDKKRISTSILNIIKDENKDTSTEETSLLNYVISKSIEPEDIQYYKEKIINIGIALKLAIRTFKLE